MSTPQLPREDLVAAVSARRELGPDYDDAFVESLVDRIEETMRARQVADTARHHRSSGQVERRARAERGSSLALAIISLVAAVPLSAIGVVNADLPGLLIVWLGIVLVNVVFAVRGRF